MNDQNNTTKPPLGSTCPLEGMGGSFDECLTGKSLAMVYSPCQSFHGLHTPEDIRAMGRRVAGQEAFFLQTFKDSGDLIAGGEAFTPTETRVLLAALQENVPNAQIRGE